MRKLIVLTVVVLASCNGTDRFEGWQEDPRRGWIWQTAWLSHDERAAVYTAISHHVHVSLHVEAAEYGDSVPVPDLLLDPRFLPHRDGQAMKRLDPALLNTLLQSEWVQGLCTLQEGTPGCLEGVPGLVLVFSPIYRARGNTIKVFVQSVGFSAADVEGGNTTVTEPLHFEWMGEYRYFLIRRRTGWSVARKETVWIT